MVSPNPFGDFRKACEESLRQALEELHSSQIPGSLLLDAPPFSEFGELASAICFELGRREGKEPLELAKQVAGTIRVKDYPLIDAVRVAGGGYVNFYVSFARLSKTTLETACTLNADYGYVKTEKPEVIIVEHTSANPIAPINIGKARNPVLGDALARILAARGHQVSRHFYVDDVGRQTAVAAYGYQKLGRPPLQEKSDHLIGRIYTLTSCLIEIERLKREVEKQADASSEVIQQLQRQLEEWIVVASELEGKYPKLFEQLHESMAKDDDSESIVNALNREYEEGKEEAVKLIREVCQLSLGGIKETLAEAGICFDSWDWESDFAWNGEVGKTLEALKKTSYVYQKGPVLEFDAEQVAEDLELKGVLGLNPEHDIPSLTLVRGDGTTLYTTRDIPYSLWKFDRAEEVINVVGMEQRLPQLQLKLALWALGHAGKAAKLTHFAYNLVTLPGYKMSSRRGRYITLDEVMKEAKMRAYQEVENRSPNLTEDEKRAISNTVGIGALKYALVQVDPVKPVVFTWDRVLNFEKNSAPYIQYSYARARSILRRAPKPTRPGYSLFVEPAERDLILTLAKFPEVFINSAESLKPNTIADYANLLADKFNSFYNALPVIKAKPKALSSARLALVEAVSIVLRNSMALIGIVTPEKM